MPKCRSISFFICCTNCSNKSLKKKTAIGNIYSFCDMLRRKQQTLEYILTLSFDFSLFQNRWFCFVSFNAIVFYRHVVLCQQATRKMSCVASKCVFLFSLFFFRCSGRVANKTISKMKWKWKQYGETACIHK